MQSSGSANIITQLGYLQNDAGKGHFGTRERVGGPGAAPVPAPPGLRGCGAVPAGPGRAGGLRAPPAPPAGGPGDRTLLFPHSFPFSHGFFLPFFLFFPLGSALQPGAHRRRAANFGEHPPGFTGGEARKLHFLGLFFIIWGFSRFFFVFFFFLPTERGGAARPGAGGDAQLGTAAPREQRSGRRAPGARPGRRAGAAPGWSRGAATGAPPFNLCPPLIAPHLSRAPRAPPFPGAPPFKPCPPSPPRAPPLPARRGRS